MGLDLEEPIDEENNPGLGTAVWPPGGLLPGPAVLARWTRLRHPPHHGCLNRIHDGRQKESPDYWLSTNPWGAGAAKHRHKSALRRPHSAGRKETRWIETEEIIAEAYDQITIPGFDTTCHQHVASVERRPVAKLTR
ncbi:glycogen/starch/alpha-glucan phosphorylase [Klebsiella pneumoniae]|nr:glycogen/starch/alpha-glucan phosphorylase [Klebsiella pneumoniae]